jgi:hypothetical protein
MTSLRRIQELKADARYHRERRDRYRAKMYGPRPASLVHLKELERVCVRSESRLRRAEQELNTETARLQALAEPSERDPNRSRSAPAQKRSRRAPI